MLVSVYVISFPEQDAGKDLTMFAVIFYRQVAPQVWTRLSKGCCVCRNLAISLTSADAYELNRHIVQSCDSDASAFSAQYPQCLIHSKHHYLFKHWHQCYKGTYPRSIFDVCCFSCISAFKPGNGIFWTISIVEVVGIMFLAFFFLFFYWKTSALSW